MKFGVVLLSIFSVTRCYPFNLNNQEDTINDDLKDRQYIPHKLKELIPDKLEKLPRTIGIERIYGGQEATKNAYPFQVALEPTLKTGQKGSCGGTIISDTYVLTAAHCLENVVNVTVILGAHDRFDASEAGRQTQVVLKKNFIVHKSWNPKNVLNDIALIKLNSVLIFTAQINAVALATNDFESIDGRAAIITGWGHYNTNNELSQTLQFTQSEIINNTECQKTFGDFVKPTNVCLDGSKGQGTCNGDSGGPLLVVGLFNQLVQVGITSFGSNEGCDKLLPTVYTRITKYITWISKNAKLD